jgi:hypothetical protein
MIDDIPLADCQQGKQSSSCCNLDCFFCNYSTVTLLTRFLGLSMSSALRLLRPAGTIQAERGCVRRGPAAAHPHAKCHRKFFRVFCKVAAAADPAPRGTQPRSRTTNAVQLKTLFR